MSELSGQRSELRPASSAVWSLVDLLIQRSVELGTTPPLKAALFNLAAFMLQGSPTPRMIACAEEALNRARKIPGGDGDRYFDAAQRLIHDM
ncbi:MAG: hypothetical protein PHS44_04465 [Candidatus Dojkabacteria bacterium]|jgi:hypothetical protein|nr:hypothetical protein [Candidatus Dojkabacteria bacterium]